MSFLNLNRLNGRVFEPSQFGGDVFNSGPRFLSFDSLKACQIFLKNKDRRIEEKTCKTTNKLKD